MKRSGFWTLFHEVWGEDKSLGLGEDYDKKAWMYVQNKIEEYKRKNVSVPYTRLKDRRS